MPAKTPNPIDLHVGRRVRERRMQLGVSQEKLAEALGVSFQQVQKYEKGTNRIGASRLSAIAQALGITVNEFFPSAVDGAEVGGTIEPLDPQSYRVAMEFSRIPDPAMRLAIAKTVSAAAAGAAL